MSDRHRKSTSRSIAVNLVAASFICLAAAAGGLAAMTTRGPAPGVAPQEGEDLAAAAALLEEHRYERARALLERIVDRDSSSARAEFLLGRVLLASGDHDGAVDHLESAAELDPGSPEIHFWLGRACLDKVDHVSIFSKLSVAGCAREALERAVALDGSDVEARSWLANYYWSAPGLAGGDDDKALEQVDAIRLHDPITAHRVLATFRWGDGEHSRATDHYRAILELDPDDADAHYQLGRLYQETGEYGAALQAVEKAVQSAPEMMVAYYQIGRVAALSGRGLARGKEALATYLGQESLEPAYRASAHWRLGMIHELEGDPDRALAEYRRGLEADPDHEELEKALSRLRRGS